MAIKEDTQAMINPPDGFDARNYHIMQLCFHGIRLRQVPNLLLINSGWFVHPKKAVDLRLLLGPKHFYPEGSTISSCLSIREHWLKLESADPLLSISKKHFLTQSMAGEFTMDKLDIIAIPQGQSMELNCSLGI